MGFKPSAIEIDVLLHLILLWRGSRPVALVLFWRDVSLLIRLSGLAPGDLGRRAKMRSS